MLLLDTHVWLWSVEGDVRRIGSIARDALADPLDRLLVATARRLDATLLTCDARVLEYATFNWKRACPGRRCVIEG